MSPNHKASATVGIFVAADGLIVVDGNTMGPHCIPTAPCREESGGTDPGEVARQGVCRLSYYPQYGLVLSRLAVDPNSKGQKLGSALLDLAESEARALGDTHLTLKTPSQHPFLVDYYLAAGYRRQGEHFTPGDRYVEAVLVKSLV